jgi:hypothetical protein
LGRTLSPSPFLHSFQHQALKQKSHKRNELFAALQRDFSERQLVELTAAITWENYRARFNRAFRVEAEGFSHGKFCPLPEQTAAPHNNQTRA